MNEKAKNKTLLLNTNEKRANKEKEINDMYQSVLRESARTTKHLDVS